ncbi:MAG: PadR family transcriptional regulator [Gemmatimonadales bacterium]
MADSSLDLLQGTVDVLILKATSWGPLHGFGISRWIRARTDGALGLQDAALYQALHRLERRGWLASDWGSSDNNRRAKFYTLTAAGREELRARTKDLRRYLAALFDVLDAKSAAV